MANKGVGGGFPIWGWFYTHHHCIYAGVTNLFISLLFAPMAKQNLLLPECVGRWWQPAGNIDIVP